MGTHIRERKKGLLTQDFLNLPPKQDAFFFKLEEEKKKYAQNAFHTLLRLS